MQVLVVHAHPDPDSYSAALRDRAVAGLKAGGHDVTALDLYALGFRADMTEDERRAYETGSPILDPMVRAHADLVRAADVLVFVYPTWWWGLPAIMKGWLERVFVPGVAFDLNAETNKVTPGMRQVRRIVGVTTYGSKRLYMRAVGDAGRTTICRTVRVLAPILGCRTVWLGLYGMDRTTPQERTAFLDQVERRMAAL